MRWYLVLISLIFSIDLFAKDYPDFDEGRPTIFILRGVMVNGYGLDSPLYEDQVKLINSLVESEKFNLAFYGDKPQGFDQKLEKAFGKEIVSKNFHTWEDSSSPHKAKMQKDLDNGEMFVVDSAQSEHVFYKIVDRYHNKAQDLPFEDSGIDPYRNVPESQSILFELGANAFADDFDMKELTPKIYYTPWPICKLGEVEMRIAVCISIVEKEYKWIDPENKICGTFEKGMSGKEKALEKVHYLMCEPERVRNFEGHLGLSVVPSCLNAKNCLEKVSGDILTELTGAFLEISLFDRVQDQRDKVYKDEGDEYTEELDKLDAELKEFKRLCEDAYLEQWLPTFLKDSDKKEAYQNALNKIETNLAQYLGPHLDAENVDDARERAFHAYNQCIFHTVEQGVDSLFPSFKNCEYIAFSEAMLVLGENLAAGDSHHLSSLKFEMEGVCPLGKSAKLDFNNANSEHFNLSYDSKRCFDALKKESERVKRREQFLGLDSKSRMMANNTREEERFFSEYMDECLIRIKDDSNKEEKCQKESYIKVKGRSLYLKLTKKGVDYKDEKGQLRRSDRIRDDFIRAFLDDESHIKCYEEKLSQECEEKAFALLKRADPTSMFRPSSTKLAREALREDLKPLVKDLSRDISVFHWGSEDLTGISPNEPTPLSSPKALGYVMLREYMFHTGPFLDKRVADAGATMAGRGFYAAADPNVTTDYGTTLYQIDLDKGLTFLDLREGFTNGEIPISKDTIRKLQSAGCDVDPYAEKAESRVKRRSNSNHLKERRSKPKEVEPRAHDFVYDGYKDDTYLVSKAAFEKIPACHKVFSSVVGDLDLNFLAYNYDMMTPKFCDNTRRNPAAFVMIDVPIMGHVTTFNQAAVDEVLKNHREKGTPIPSRYKRLLQINEGAFATGDFEDTDDDEVVEYWKDRIFTCDATISEDQVQNKERY